MHKKTAIMGGLYHGFISIIDDYNLKLIGSTTRNLDLNKKGCIVADEVGTTSRPGIFAGGDAVSGAATVILAMGAGKKAAKAIDEYIKSLHH